MKTLPRNQILAGDAREVLPTLLPESADAAVTSPPYFRLRDYDGGQAELGREATAAEYVENLRGVCRLLGRVLKPNGALWLNLSDTYSQHPRMGAPRKSLLLVPEQVAAALIADGWILRSKVIWAKPNPLPHSVRDRLSPTWEVVYFFTRAADYFFDLDAIRIPHRSAGRAGRANLAEAGRRYVGGNGGLGSLKATGRVGHPNGKNPGDVWTIPTASYRGEHFATFPAELIERPILSTVPERICTQCDGAWTRPTRILTVHTNEGTRQIRKVGDLRRCDCFAPSRAGLVLDPFCGTNVTGEVAEKLGRDWLGIELNPDYRALAEQRLACERRAA